MINKIKEQILSIDNPKDLEYLKSMIQGKLVRGGNISQGFTMKPNKNDSNNKSKNS